MSTWLAFDAGSPVTSAAVARDATVLAASCGESRSGPSLLQHIDDSLRRAGVQPSDLDGIVVLSGPGSFTGIRVALATALGLRAALAVRVVALSNLAALALQAESAQHVVALVDALRDEWFVQEFRQQGRELTAQGSPARIDAAAVVVPSTAVLVAHQAQALPARLAQRPLRRAADLAGAVASAASDGRLQDLLADDLAPLYLRAFTPRGAQA